MFYFLITLIPYIMYLVLKYRRSFYMLQQNSYNVSNRYGKWIFKNIKKVFLNYDLFFIILIILYPYINHNFYMFFMAIFYFGLFYLELKNIKKDQNKKPFAITKRIKRLTITTLLLFGIVLLLIFINFNLDKNLLRYYIYLFVYCYLGYFITYLANIINYPVERMVYYYYYYKAVNKLNSMPNLVKIGITGSYGKTTSKNILNTILNIKFNSFATKKSLNTPYGLMTSINNDLDKFDDVFIAEMGACKKNDIKELCDLVHPQYGIITKIGLAHLETFKTIENTISTKFELVEALPRNGVAILNKDDPNQRKYHIKNNCKVKWIAIDNDADIRALNIKQSNKGMNFDILLEGKNYNFETPLLGRANIYNILAGIYLGYYLGIEIKDLQIAVKMLRPTEHRLELKKMGDITIIDDAFNSNPEGSKMALEVLDLMEGTKVVVTPGMIELGKEEYNLNRNFGKEISKAADYVILVGEKQTKPIYDGLISAKFSKDKIIVINDVKKSFSLIRDFKEKDKELYALLENDLPDIFNEK